MGLELAKAWIRLRVDRSALPEGFRGVRKETEKNMASIGSIVLSNMAKMGAALGAFDVMKRSLTLASQAEDMMVSFKVMLGGAEAAKRMMADLNEFAAKTPFELPGILQATKVLLAFGIEQDEVMGQLKMLGDISAGTGKNFTELAIVFGQIRAAGKLMGQDLLQLINAGIPIIGELAKHFGVAESEIRDMVSKGKVGFEDVAAVLRNMTEEGGLFFNLMEKKSRTILGRYSTLKDAINIGILKPLGEAFAPAVKTILESALKLSDFVSKNIGVISGLAKVILVVVGASKAWHLTIGLLNKALLSLATHPVMGMFTGMFLVLRGVTDRFVEVKKEVREAIESATEYRRMTEEQISSHSRLIGRLGELSEKGRLNNAEMREANSIISVLSGRYGDLGLEIDESSKKLIGFTEAQRRFHEQSRKMRLRAIESEIMAVSNLLKEQQKKVGKAETIETLFPFSVRTLGLFKGVEEVGEDAVETMGKLHELMRQRDLLTSQGELERMRQLSEEGEIAADVEKETTEKIASIRKKLAEEEERLRIESIENERFRQQKLLEMEYRRRAGAIQAIEGIQEREEERWELLDQLYNNWQRDLANMRAEFGRQDATEMKRRIERLQGFVRGPMDQYKRRMEEIKTLMKEVGTETAKELGVAALEKMWQELESRKTKRVEEVWGRVGVGDVGRRIQDALLKRKDELPAMAKERNKELKNMKKLLETEINVLENMNIGLI